MYLFHSVCPPLYFMAAHRLGSTSKSVALRSALLSYNCVKALCFISSLSHIHEQIFRLLLKISVCERHQLRLNTIYQASSLEALKQLQSEKIILNTLPGA